MLPIFDNLKILEGKYKKSILKVLDPDETVYWTGLLDKINIKKKKQSRRFILTDKHFFNIGDTGQMDSLISGFTGSIAKRKIQIENIKYITYSSSSNEWILHIPTQYDYRLSSQEYRHEFIEYLLQQKEQKNAPNTVFIIKQQPDLYEFCTYEGQKRTIILENSLGTEMNHKEFKNYYFNKPRRTFYSSTKYESFNDKNQNMKTSSKCNNNSYQEISIEDFETIRVIGRGSYGKVVLCRKKDTQKIYAIKMINKIKAITMAKLDALKEEKNIMENANHPFLLKLEFTFHDHKRVYLVMNFLQGGELFTYLKQSHRFTEIHAKFYAGQILLGLEAQHDMNIIYRDQCPENVVLDNFGYVKLIDFGCSKKLLRGHHTFTQIGTPEYVSPEVIKNEGHDRTTDFWCFGMLLYEMVVGTLPWIDSNDNNMYSMIINEDIWWPEESKNLFSKEIMDLIGKLLEKDPKKRLGSKTGAKEIKDHPWWAEFSWKDLLERKQPAPNQPKIDNELDYSNFDTMYLEQNVKKHYYDVDGNDEKILESFQDQFEDFDTDFKD